MHRRLIELDKAKWALPLVPLEEPYHHGYIRYFILREDVARRNDAHIFRHILDKINTRIWSPRKDFHYKGQGKGKKLRPMLHVIRHLTLEEFNEYTAKQKQYFEKRMLSQTQERLDSYLRLINSPNAARNRRARRSAWKATWGWFFTKPTYFVIKQEKCYVTHRRAIDPEIESESKHLRNTINRQHLWPHIWKLLEGSNGNKCWWDSPDKTKYSDEDFKRQLITMDL